MSELSNLQYKKKQLQKQLDEINNDLDNSKVSMTCYLSAVNDIKYIENSISDINMRINELIGE